MCDGDVFESNVELLGALEEVGTYSVDDCFTLCDEFCGIELGDDGFEDFVSDGWEDSLIIILTKVLFPISPIVRSHLTCTSIPDKSLASSVLPVCARL